MQAPDKNHSILIIEATKSATTPLFSASPDSVFGVGAFTLGYARDVFADARLRVAVAGDVTFYHMPAALEPIYGSKPVSFHVGLRIRPGKIGGH